MTRLEEDDLDQNTKEFLGMTRADFWYYPGFALLLIGGYLDSAPAVIFLFSLSTILVVIFLIKSFSKYLGSSDLRLFTRLFGLAGNVFLILLQIVVILGKFLSLIR